MNKNSRNIVIAIVVIIVIALVIWFGRGSGSSSPAATQNPLDQVQGTSTTPLPVSETTKVSGSLSQYQNAELGFAVNYPSSWEKADTNNGVQFVVPVDPSQVSTVNRLEADITVSSAKCAFPPVTTVDSRSTLKVGTSTLNMIAISNDVQGRTYFNRMYSLQQGPICYFFSFSYVALSPDSKGLTGSNLTQAKNNNNAIKSTADSQFTDMVKSLTFVAPPAGESETQAAPAKR